MDWDEIIPASVSEVWFKWESELSYLSGIHIPRFYFADILSSTLFNYTVLVMLLTAVFYIRSQDRDGSIGVSLVITKSRVSPIKRFLFPSSVSIVALS